MDDATNLYLCSCSCRSLSTFRVGKWGEVRGYSTAKLDLYVNIRKSQLFNELPTNLANFERWLPSFKLLPDTCTPLSSVHVILQPKSSATARLVRVAEELQESLECVIEFYLYPCYPFPTTRHQDMPLQCYASHSNHRYAANMCAPL